VPALPINDYLDDHQKPSNQYRIDLESSKSRDYLILDALSEVYHIANENMLMDEEKDRIITDIKD